MTEPEVLECSLDDLVDCARALIVPGERRLLGLAGAPGAGKSTVAAHLVAALASRAGTGAGRGAETGAAALVPMDGFHLANSVLRALGRADRKGAPDTFDDAGYAALLRRLRDADPSETVYAPEYRREVEESISSAVAVPADLPLVVTEGNYLLLEQGAWPRARAQLDQVWFVDLDERVRIDRLVRRHEAFGKLPEAARAWAFGSDQRNADLVAATRDRADLVVRLR